MNFSKDSEPFSLRSKVTSKSRAIAVFHILSDAQSGCSRVLRALSLPAVAQHHPRWLCSGTACWASLIGLAPPHCHRAPRWGQGNHLCTHSHCKALSFSCISLNKISHYTWWISSVGSSSASPDLHEFILSGEIKRQFIQLLALLGVAIIPPCRSVSITCLWLYII